MAVDYNAISKIYDKVRSENKSIWIYSLKRSKLQTQQQFWMRHGKLHQYAAKTYTGQSLRRRTFRGMREKAIAKNPNITVTKGDLENIPFEDNYFDFVYMTDAIHHIPDIEMMFKEIGRVSKKVETFA